jgi:hypothetical protein
MHLLRWAAEARLAAEPHSITYVDFLTVTLTAMCVLLAALGFIVALVALVGYRDIKAASIKAGKQASETAIEAKLKEYPDATQIHAKFKAVDEFFAIKMKEAELLSRVRVAPSGIAKASKTKEDKPVKRPDRYPPKGV